MKSPRHTVVVVAFVGSLTIFAQSIIAQGTFQNLDFEQANPVPVAGTPFATTASCFPGWACFLGPIQITQVLYNDETLGDASIDLIGPNFPFFPNPVIEGQYTVDLQPGVIPGSVNPPYESASISQMALVPGDAQYLVFDAKTYSGFTVSLGGDNLTLFPVGTGANYTAYEADISQYAGQVELLTITALAGPCINNYFDGFGFSPTAVREPSVSALLFLAGMLLSVQRLRRSFGKQKSQKSANAHL